MATATGASVGWFKTFVGNHVLTVVVGGGLAALGSVLIFGVVAYMDIRHVQREEHKATLGAFALERRCAMRAERLSDYILRMENINREQARLRNYNGRAPDQTSYLVQARQDTIADLNAEKESLAIGIAGLPNPEGCEEYQ